MCGVCGVVWCGVCVCVHIYVKKMINCFFGFYIFYLCKTDLYNDMSPYYKKENNRG